MDDRECRMNGTAWHGIALKLSRTSFDEAVAFGVDTGCIIDWVLSSAVLWPIPSMQYTIRHA